MRKSHSEQLRLDCASVNDVELNLECRDEMIPILFALQHIYRDHALRDEIMQLVASDVNRHSSADHGREGLDYWQILVLAAVRLGCNFNYDRLQDLAENHRKMRHIMGIGDWDEQTSLSWRRIHDNICLLQSDTVRQIYERIVKAAHDVDPEAAKYCRVDSFVMETNIHYPTESSLLWDGLRKIVQLSAEVTGDLKLPGWRQHAHLLKKIKNLHREIARVSSSKSPKAAQKLKTLYAKLLKRTDRILKRAEKLIEQVSTADVTHLAKVEDIRTYSERTRQVASTAYRRVILGETVPNEEKLFSIFEPHTQLYRRGKAGQENQFGRLAMICEDGAGLITHHYLLRRDEQDVDVGVPQTKILQDKLGGAIEEISFDRGFYSEANEMALNELVRDPCLPKRGVTEYTTQMNTASVRFRTARRRHAGVESAIGALQSGNGTKRCRDRTEMGFERYLSLAILGRNLHVFGKMLIARTAPDSLAGQSERHSAA